MDIMLAGSMDGIEAAKQIRAQLGIPVIFLTAYTDEKTLERAKEVEPFGYILKPFKERELYTTIDIALYKNSIDKKLRKQERLFSAILHSINDGIIATDTEMAVGFMNKVAEGITGWTEAAAKGRHAAGILSIQDQRTQRELLVTVAAQRGREALLLQRGGRSRTRSARPSSSTAPSRGSTRRRTSPTASSSRSGTSPRSSGCPRPSTTRPATTTSPASPTARNSPSCSTSSSRASGPRTRATPSSSSTSTASRPSTTPAAPWPGDELLRQIASHVQANISRKDISARIGGDEFAIILRDCEPEDSINVAKRLKGAVEARKFAWQASVFPVTLSIGIVSLSQESEDTHTVLAAADDACHLSKEEGGNRVNVFQAKDTKYQKRRGDMEWIAKINKATEENRFVLYQQAIVPLSDSLDLKPKAEILLRLVNEDGSIARPGDFIPAAERYNLMPLIDHWVIKNSHRRLSGPSPTGARELADSIISINLSGPSLLDESLVDLILYEVSRNGLERSSFCFEITETAAIQNSPAATRFIKRLKDEGFTFALDDFGSGFSSFSYLKNLPVDYLKIDGAFVQTIDESLVSYTMVDSINSIGHVMGIKTIAEFVKNPEIKRKCAEIGVDYAQGYHIAEPVPLL